MTDHGSYNIAVEKQKSLIDLAVSIRSSKSTNFLEFDFPPESLDGFLE
jgi:hypothetical protein